MKLFSRFFRKAPPPPPTLEQRIAILDSGSPELILGTAFGAEEESLRVAAVHKLPDGDALRSLAGLSGHTDNKPGAFPAALERAAQARIAQLIDEGSIDFAGFCAQVPSRTAMLSAAALCKLGNRLPQALASIDDPAEITRLIVDSPASRVRQSAAEFVDDPAQLRELLKQVRSKDKSVYKIIKQKCDALTLKERKEAQIASEVGAVCAALERHSQRTHDALYTAAFEQLNTRWRSITTHPPANIEQRAEEAIDRCREVIAAHLRQVAQQAAEQSAQQLARQSAHDAEERALQETRAAASAQADTEAQHRQEAAAARETEERLRAEKWAAEDQAFRQIGGLIRKANGALNDGNTQRAAGVRRAIDEKLPTAPPLPGYMVRQLEQLDGKLNELKQWKDYAVAPKRIELIEEMEALVGLVEEPKILADRIKALQEEWRTIGKGIVSEAPQDWERFHQASQAAYQPCREYYEAQAKLRHDNLESRKAVLERLTAFEAAQNSQNLDWRLLSGVLREAPQEWRRYFPVDREAGRALQGDFDGSIGRLQAKLDAWHERNVADKQSLINRARQLLAQDDSREAIEAAKGLQILWKETGVAPRDRDRLLWSEFRELCDAIYQKRQQAYTEYNAGLEANKVKAVALCEEAERVAVLSGAALLEQGAKIAEWRGAYDALDEMPRADARGLEARFERALDLCKARMVQQRERDTEQSFTSLLEAGRQVRAYEWAVMGNAAPPERESLKQSAETFIAGVQHWPKGGLQAVNGALGTVDAASGDDAASGADAREKALRMLCVRCEIQSETSTPPEDEALRREYQVQRLMKGMGQGSRMDEGDWGALAFEWIRIGAIPPATYEILQARFLRCRNQAPAAR